MAALHTRIQEIRQQIAPGSRLAQACDYALRQWHRVSVYLEHGQVEIDTNICNAARGITKIMPLPLLCRVVKLAVRL